MPLTRDEQARLMDAAKMVADKAVLIMSELGVGDFVRAADLAGALNAFDLVTLRRKISEAGEKTNWGIA